ncbi:MAG: CCA tRNA nucleotidyltransferase [Nostocaceae cyanobacterium]|nr:CCA tRNA nucleotidyltransferase [Nostocaceae cyanobacterium]
MHPSVHSYLSPDKYPFSLEFLPKDACMVGGAVRDALLGRTREYLDLDFVVPSKAVQIARKIAKHYKAGFVLLDRERQIARVVFPHATADFALQEGESLERDLQRRDFTINAIAYNPHSQEIIDPLQGCADLNKGILRMVSPTNLQDDPLRLLRGYRQAAQLGFAIAPETRSTIRELAPLLSNIAAERVRVELAYLLGSPAGTPWLTIAWDDGILPWVLHDDITVENLALLAAIDRATVTLSETWQQLGVELSSQIPGLAADSKRTLAAVAKLTALLIPKTWFREIPAEFESYPYVNYTRGDITVQNSPLEAFLRRMTYSVPEMRAVHTILKSLPQIQDNSPSVRQQYFFFREVGAVLSALVVVAAAMGTPPETITPLITRYLNPQDIVAHPKPLVTGKQLMQALQLPSSPTIGKLLTECAIAQIQGKISTPQEAIKFSSQTLDTL